MRGGYRMTALGYFEIVVCCRHWKTLELPNSLDPLKTKKNVMIFNISSGVLCKRIKKEKKKEFPDVSRIRSVHKNALLNPTVESRYYQSRLYNYFHIISYIIIMRFPEPNQVIFWTITIDYLDSNSVEKKKRKKTSIDKSNNSYTLQTTLRAIRGWGKHHEKPLLFTCVRN